ncbi:hypothetical protein F3Y22_tig00110328pilonHSYRG00371 [Hibiscus syriacus]|uniref:RNase H type-1 domain-containing protein n=1 Tax=Hibiscus syriacus TaxID=106335 RepID=A0A6A3B3B0_HIBSY|nr:hypothetical protein F3Y22_tig00110328pilonHSYRG00371 [Hibiscus syriacus]
MDYMKEIEGVIQNSTRCISLAKGRESSSNYRRRPMEGWIKMNTDAAVDIVDDQAVVGCVFHLDQGDWLFGSSRRTGNALVVVIKELLQRNWEVRLGQVQRAYNSVADKMAALVQSLSMREALFIHPPSQVEDLLQLDEQHSAVEILLYSFFLS